VATQSEFSAQPLFNAIASKHKTKFSTIIILIPMSAQQNHPPPVVYSINNTHGDNIGNHAIGRDPTGN